MSVCYNWLYQEPELLDVTLVNNTHTCKLLDLTRSTQTVKNVLRIILIGNVPILKTVQTAEYVLVCICNNSALALKLNFWVRFGSASEVLENKWLSKPTDSLYLHNFNILPHFLFLLIVALHFNHN